MILKNQSEPARNICLGFMYQIVVPVIKGDKKNTGTLNRLTMVKLKIHVAKCILCKNSCINYSFSSNFNSFANLFLHSNVSS